MPKPELMADTGGHKRRFDPGCNQAPRTHLVPSVGRDGEAPLVMEGLSHSRLSTVLCEDLRISYVIGKHYEAHPNIILVEL